MSNHPLRLGKSTATISLEKLCRIAKVYDEESIEDDLVKGSDTYIRRIVHHYCVHNAQANLADFVSEVKSRSSILKRAGCAPNDYQRNYKVGMVFNRKPSIC